VALATGIARARARRRAADLPDALFVWVPKTAGTSLWELLARAGGLKCVDPLSVRYEFPDRGLVTFGHAHYPSLVDQGALNPAFVDRAFRFAVVRHPVDRTISLYEYLRKIGRLPVGISFRRFVEVIGDGGVEPVGAHHGDGLSTCNPQAAWLVDDAGVLRVDEVFRFECLADAVDQLRTRFPIAGALPHHNTTDRRPRADYLTPPILRMIEAAYRDDFTRFGYDL